MAKPRRPRRPKRRRRAARRAGQQRLEFRPHGGARRGAGRKPKRPNARRNVAHRARRTLDRRTPVHVTIRVRRVPSLRSQRLSAVVLKALRAGNARGRFRIVHFSIQRDHVHLIVEATGKPALARGMQGLSVRIARQINKELGRRGPVLADRYHDRQLQTPTQVRRCLAYVLNNFLHHIDVPPWERRDYVDPLSSATAFDGWTCQVHCPDPRPPPVVPPRTWLLDKGWRRSKLGLLRPMVPPGA